ncbi:MAG: histidine kinase [Burkholderiales bacterium]|nr:histidine kinase [Burkholderiales bacterium]
MPALVPRTAAESLRGFVGRGLVTQGLCAVIGLALWQLGGRGLLAINLAYSFAIGNCCWLLIDGAIHGLARWLPPPGGSAPQWPGVPLLALAVALGSAAGYSIGAGIVDHFTGMRSPSLFDSRAAGVITLLAAVAATYFFHSRERLHMERAATEAAHALALEHQLKLLQSQLEPHMLFNTLANLRALIGIDPPLAQAMLDRLIAFLRATLAASRADAHPLADEFARLADYLALMEVRMGPRLQASLELPDELRDCAVPPLLLQPLAENAVKHGLEPKVAGGRICVRARRVGDELELSVRDTGVGLPQSAPVTGAPALGVAGDAADVAAVAAGRYGTAHVRSRLQAMFGRRARFELRPAGDADGGTLALIVLPCQRPTSRAAA